VAGFFVQTEAVGHGVLPFASIGAGAGAAGGAAVQAATKGQHVKIASETRLTFTLEKPVTI